jgi:pantetheine-phosphate adenylyltransferase
MRVMVGGTFDPLHAGHRKLLSRSFDLAGPAGEVVIGLTTDEFAGTKEHPVRPYRERLNNVTAFILEKGYTASWAVEPLSDRYGSAVDADFDILVVSEETFHVALDINEGRPICCLVRPRRGRTADLEHPYIPGRDRPARAPDQMMWFAILPLINQSQ